MGLARENRGSTVVEYLIALALVALIALSAFEALGAEVEEHVDCAANAIGGGGGPCGAAPAAAPGDSIAQPGEDLSDRERRADALVETGGHASEADRAAVVREVAQLPDEVLARLEEQGTEIVVSEGNVADVVSDLSDRRPRGWDPESTYEDVDGIYDPRTNRVVVSSDAPPGTVIHETTHALDYHGGGQSYDSSSREFRAAWANAGFDKDGYYGEGRAGREEAYAESYRRFLQTPDALRRDAPDLYRYWSEHSPGDTPGAHATAAAGAGVAPPPAPWDDAAGWIGDRLEDAGDVAADFVRHVQGPAEDVIGFGLGVVGGEISVLRDLAGVSIDGALSTLSALDPRNVLHAITHPGETWEALQNGVGDVVDHFERSGEYAWEVMLHGSWEDRGRLLGRGLLGAALRAPAPVLGEEPSGAPAEYPILLLHGFNASTTNSWSFHGVVDALRADGHEVVAVEVPAFNSVEVRSRYVAAAIDEALEQYGADRVNLIAHSMGGLDARYTVSSLGYGDRIASVTTISTPHRGTLIADIGQTLVPEAANPIAGWWARTFNRHGDDTDIRAAFHDLAMRNSAAFNAANQDDPRVYYQSWAGVSSPGGLPVPGLDEACDGKVAFPSGTMDHLDGRLIPQSPFAGGWPNDGLVSVESSKWGNFQGCIPADHLDEVGQVGDELPDYYTGFDHIRFYRNLAFDLAERGY